MPSAARTARTATSAAPRISLQQGSVTRVARTGPAYARCGGKPLPPGKQGRRNPAAIAGRTIYTKGRWQVNF
jgi:hypothetical protein